MNASHVKNPILKAFLFGNPEFWLNDKILSLPPTRKTLSLLAYLLLHPLLADALYKQHGGDPWEIEKGNLNLLANFVASLD